jgi:YD repeat-containing protein
VAELHYWDPANRQITASMNSGDPTTNVVVDYFPGTRRLRSMTDASGVKTTYAYDTEGNVQCMVRGDDDDDACNPAPPGSQATQIVTDYGARTQRKLTPSLLSTGASIEQRTSWSEAGKVTERRTMGYTRDIDGSLVGPVSKVSTYTYDADGQVSQVDGPLDNAVAYDVTDYSYWESSEPANAASHKRLRAVTRYVGTAGAKYPLRVEYANYDLQGVARTVKEYDIDGASVVRTTTLTSTNQLDWTITTAGPGGSPAATSEVHLNPDGRVRYTVDPDGVCVTYQYSQPDTGTPTSGPSVIKRTKSGTSGCGTLPIVTTTGEVEIREYDDGYGVAVPEKLVRVRRLQNGSVRFDLSGFVYDQERQLEQLDTPHSSSKAMSRPVLKLGGGRGGDHYAAFARAARGTSASRRLESAASQSLATAPRSSRTCPATGRSRPLAGHAEP